MIMTMMTIMMMTKIIMMIATLITFVPSGRGESTQPPMATTDQSDEDEVTVTCQGHIQEL